MIRQHLCHIHYIYLYHMLWKLNSVWMLRSPLTYCNLTTHRGIGRAFCCYRHHHHSSANCHIMAATKHQAALKLHSVGLWSADRRLHDSKRTDRWMDGERVQERTLLVSSLWASLTQAKEWCGSVEYNRTKQIKQRQIKKTKRKN